jgi:hypothetical protein
VSDLPIRLTQQQFDAIEEAGKVILGRADVDRHGRVYAIRRRGRHQIGVIMREGGYQQLAGIDGIGFATFGKSGPHLVVADKAEFLAYLGEHPEAKAKLAEAAVLGAENAYG